MGGTPCASPLPSSRAQFSAVALFFYRVALAALITDAGGLTGLLDFCTEAVLWW